MNLTHNFIDTMFLYSLQVDDDIQFGMINTHVKYTPHMEYAQDIILGRFPAPQNIDTHLNNVTTFTTFSPSTYMSGAILLDLL